MTRFLVRGGWMVRSTGVTAPREEGRHHRTLLAEAAGETVEETVGFRTAASPHGGREPESERA